MNRLDLRPDYSLPVKRAQIQEDSAPDDDRHDPRNRDKSFGPWIAPPGECHDERRLVSNQFRKTENVVKWIWVGEDPDPCGWQRHEPGEVCGPAGTARYNRQIEKPTAKTKIPAATQPNMNANGTLAGEPISQISLTVCCTWL